MENVFTHLESLGIHYTTYNHPALFTVDDAKHHKIDADFGENKNLFLKNRNGTKHFLVTIAASKQLDLKTFGEQIGEKGVGFASEDRLMKYLGVTKGSVSPFGLINDTEKQVSFMLDNDLLKYENLGFHPNINTQTVVLHTQDFKKFLENTGNPISFIDVS